MWKKVIIERKKEEKSSPSTFFNLSFKKSTQKSQPEKYNNLDFFKFYSTFEIFSHIIATFSWL